MIIPSSPWVGAAVGPAAFAADSRPQRRRHGSLVVRLSFQGSGGVWLSPHERTPEVRALARFRGRGRHRGRLSRPRPRPRPCWGAARRSWPCGGPASVRRTSALPAGVASASHCSRRGLGAARSPRASSTAVLRGATARSARRARHGGTRQGSEGPQGETSEHRCSSFSRASRRAWTAAAICNQWAKGHWCWTRGAPLPNAAMH